MPPRDIHDVSQYRKPPAAEVGLRADRGCTNVFFTILFLLFWVLMGYVCVVAYGLGDLDRLRYGVDYLGNVCSKGDPKIHFQGGQDTPWSERTKLWYPVGYSKDEGFIIKRALKLGVCVKECPTKSTSVFHPNKVHPYTDPDSSVTYSGYHVLFDSKLKFNRCIPDLLDFSCESLPVSWRKNCVGNRGNTTVGISSVYGVMEDGFQELAHNWWVILVCGIIAILICFIWMFCLRRLVKPMVVISLFLVLAAIGILAYFLFLKSKRLKETAPHDDTHKWYFYGSIAMCVVAFIYICVVLFLFRDIMLACDIIEEASKVPLKIPTMMAVPPILVLCIIPFLIFACFTAAVIYTAAKSFTHELPVINFNFDDSPSHIHNITNGTNVTTAPPSADTITMKEYTFENWRIYAHIFNLFMFLWTMGFIHAIGYMITAFCAIFWYWSVPGDDKQPEHGPLKAAGLTLRYHLGTLALGSMIIAIIQVIRVIMRLMEERMEAVSKKVDVAKFLIKCAECCLACFERIIKYINKNAYIMTAMTGESFLPAARHGVSLLMGNALSVGAVSIISEYVMTMGKILITAAVVASGYGILTRTDRDEGYSNGILVLVAVGLLAYFIACVFINIFGVCIDTVLLSYCYDVEQNNGADKPHYFPEDLAKHVRGAGERLQEAKRKKQVETEQPLNSPKQM